MEELPRELVWELLAKLENEDLFQLTQVDHRLRNICQSEDFWKFKLSKEFSNASEILAEKPTTFNYLQWYTLVENWQNDEISKSLQLTILQSNERRLAEIYNPAYSQRFRHPLIILVQAIRSGDFGYFQRHLPEYLMDRNYAVASSFLYSDDDFINLLVKSALLSYDLRFIEALRQLNPTWFDLNDYIEANISHPYYRFLSSNQRDSLILTAYLKGEKLPIESDDPTQFIALTTYQYLYGEKLTHYHPETFWMVLRNVEARDIQRASQFFDEYFATRNSDETMETHLVAEYLLDYPPKITGKNFLILPTDRKIMQLPTEANLLFDPVDGVYDYIRANYQRESIGELAILNLLLSYQDSFDLIIYLIKKYRATHSAEIRRICRKYQSQFDPAMMTLFFNLLAGDEMNYWQELAKINP